MPMKPLIRYLLPLALTALAGCQKEMPGEAGNDGYADGKVMSAMQFSIAGYDETKGLATNITDDEVDVIDVFSWDENNAIVGHKTIGTYGGTALNLSNLSFKDYDYPNAQRYYLFMANLDPDTADYIATLSGTEINGYPKGFFPWSAGNCRPSRPIMGGTLSKTFSSSNTAPVTVNLMRYMAKFEIGSVDAQFWGTPDQFRNVYLSHIVFSNSWDIVRICQSDARNFNGNPSNLFGPKGWSSASLGNLSSLYYTANQFLAQGEWGSLGLTYAHLNNTYTPGDWGARGKLDDAFDYLYNNNYMQPKNTICLDAPASLVSVSQQSWDNNAYLPRLSGKLCDEYEGSLGPFEVNKVFYTLPTCLYAYYTQPEYDPVNNQDLYHKLVIAVKINGRNYYYPFYLHHLQPNMTYRINTITLKGEPSEYPNVWPRGGVVSCSTSSAASKAQEVEENRWKIHGNVAEIDNLVL